MIINSINSVLGIIRCMLKGSKHLAHPQDEGLTFKLGSNFPASANKRVVFPDDGGPNNRAILQKYNNFNHLKSYFL